ncbi:uncharacterized protein C16orf46 homolog [Sphaeramia orbicularis]|uniref:uncharacterized protein C16orf46 homolog n=1 Tax=Sphaeramia orbicularis TaxID=375764 RepID=UPI00117D9884|nr:uncharacterized protein LOC115414696 [Sphaeramia orbicularis]XP_029983834.1 uncharacterized protein LOC115414696 [Sphaeramia orbicularis]
MMAPVKEVDHSAVQGTQGELPAEEGSGSEQPDRTPPGRRHVEALLDISEEGFLEILEPYEYHCYSGWEEAVQGWAGAAPLSSILLSQRTDKKPKQKEANSLGPRADTPVGVAEHCSQSHLGPNISKKSILLSQQMWSCGKSAASVLQPDVPVSPVLGAMPKILSHFTQEDKTEEDETPRQQHHLSAKYSVLEDRPSKPQKHHRSSNTVVPIKNFTFLPPIKTPHMNFQRVSGQNCTGRKHLEADLMAENYYIFDKMSGIRGTNSELPKDTNNAMTSKYQTCQHSPHFFSAVSVSVPKRYQVAVSSKPETLHPTSYSMGKSLHFSTAGSAQVHMHPSCLFS